MITFVAWGNIYQEYFFYDIPEHLIPKDLSDCSAPPSLNPRLFQRYQCRRLAHFLLWQLLCLAAESHSISPEILAKIHRTSSGRPQFSNQKNVDFNISHSGDWVAVILNISDSQSAVGIDIEFPQKKRDFAALLAHFAAPDEQTWFTQQSNQEKAFYRIWCLREAILKSQGVGIAKLSEVEHHPVSLTLHSIHCPKGQLCFSAELPFYFAAFVAGQNLSQMQCFQWQNGELNPFNFKTAVNYSVNF